MESKPDIQFRYALDAEGKIVSIDDVPIEYSKRGRYFFPGTGAEMIARKGKKVAWHFAHKDGNPGALETYLHNTGKYLFKQVFEAADKFTIALETPAVCVHAADCPVEERYPCHFKDYTSFNLKDFYEHCEIEKDYIVGDDTFRPDVLLLPKNAKHDPIFVEIEVTHSSTYKKCHSGIRMIEIKLESEEDFRLIEKCHISAGEKVKLHYFNVTKAVKRDRIANKKQVYSLRVDGELGFTYFDDCFSRCVDENWYSKKDKFAILFDTQGYDLTDEEVERFLRRKAIDYGYGYIIKGRNQSVMSDDTVDGHFDSYFIYDPSKSPDIQHIVESGKGYDTLMGEIAQLDLPGNSYMNRQKDYWYSLARLYDNLRHIDIDEDRLYQATYLAHQRHKYIRIINNPRYRKPEYSFQHSEHREYVPTLVPTVPAQLIEDRTNDWLFSL